MNKPVCLMCDEPVGQVLWPNKVRPPNTPCGICQDCLNLHRIGGNVMATLQAMRQKGWTEEDETMHALVAVTR